jgi:peptide/nickel transport system permease protein
MAKNLSPLSSRYLVESINEKKTNENIIEEYVGLKVKINREFVDEHFYLSDYEIVPDSNYQALHTQKIIFLLGTDEYGRDVFSRLIYATRLSLFIGVCSVLITLVIGLLLGFLSGYMGGLIDLCLNRLTETFLAFPSIFLVILFLAIFGNSLWNVVILLGLAGWMSMFKVIRGEVIFLKLKNHLITSKKMGMNLKDLLSKEFLPLLFPSILTNLTFQLCNVIIAESALSFLGLTGNGFYPTWGGMIQEGQYYLSQAWWISFFPSIFLITTLQIFNNYGRMLESTKI